MIRNVTLLERICGCCLLMCSIQLTTGHGWLSWKRNGTDSVPLISEYTKAPRKYILTSDWDDTLASSGTGFFGSVAGKDTSLSHGIIYPAVQDLYKLINTRVKIVSNNCADPTRQKSSKQARLNKWWNNYHPYHREPLQIQKVYSGVFQHSVKIAGAYFLCKCSLRKECDPSENTYKDIGERKFQHLKSIKASAPLRKIVFFGDNGQGDATAAQHALEEKIIDIGMIHISTETPTLEVPTDFVSQTLNKIDSTGLYMFMNYVQAAYIMKEIGVLGENDYKQIEEQNKIDLKTLVTLKSVGYRGIKKYLESVNCKVTEYAEGMIPKGLEDRNSVIWEDDSKKVVRGCPSIESLCQELENERAQNFCKPLTKHGKRES